LAINFTEELIRVEYVIGENMVSETVTGQVEVPNNKPDIERIIDVEANISDVEAEIENGGVNITGTIETGIIYVADVEEPYLPQPVHFMEGEFQFTNFVDIPEAEPGMNVFTDLTIRRVSFEMIDERKVEITVVLSKFVKVTEYRQITVITEITGIPEENITEELLRIEDVVGENTVTTVVTGQVTVPPGKPPIERVLNATAEIISTTAEVSDNSVIIEGEVSSGIIYVADVGEEDFQQPVHFMEGDFNFSEVIDVAGALSGMSVYPNLNIKRVSYEFIDEETVEVEVVIQFFVKVTEPKQVTVVTDVVSDLVEIENELLRVEDVVGEDTVYETITGNLNVPAAKPDIERVLEAKAHILESEVVVESGGVMIEGTIEGEILYVASVPEEELQQPVHYFEGTINFTNFVDIPGAEEKMNVHTELYVQRVNYDVLNDRTVELTVVLRKFAKVTEFKQLEIVTDLVVVSPAVEDECPPSYIVYVIQHGDTLWKISRRYRTTIEELIKANPGIDPNNLQIGQKICIPSDIINTKG
jgi:LysM repeat protein